MICQPESDLQRNEARLQYCVFDLMFIDGEDLRQAPLIERQVVCATTDRKRKIASPKNSPPISATTRNSGHTTSIPAPR